MRGVDVGLAQVLLALLLAAVAVALSFWQRVGLEREIGVAVLRAFVQLTALGVAIQLIFDTGSPGWAVLLLGAMVVLGAVTARNRAREVPGAFAILVLALALSVAATVGLALAIGILDATPRTIIPLGGMVIGNAMTAAAVTLDRLSAELRSSAREIEARLALGATAHEAASPYVRRSLRSGMINVVDSTKTAGLVFIPGTMLGMLLAGADPGDAVRLQLVLFYLLLGSVAISCVVAVTLAARRFFTASHQVRLPAPVR
jgi:putative ABC transport system permease protein